PTAVGLAVLSAPRYRARCGRGLRLRRYGGRLRRILRAEEWRQVVGSAARAGERAGPDGALRSRRRAGRVRGGRGRAGWPGLLGTLGDSRDGDRRRRLGRAGRRRVRRDGRRRLGLAVGGLAGGGGLVARGCGVLRLGGSGGAGLGLRRVCLGGVRRRPRIGSPRVLLAVALVVPVDLRVIVRAGVGPRLRRGPLL